MPFQPCPGILQLLLRFTANGQAVDNVLHVDNGSGGIWSSGNVQSIVDYIATTWWTTYIKPLLCANTTLDYVQGTDLSTQNSVQYTNTLTSGNAGTHTGTTLPGSVTAAVRFFTGIRSKGVNGRMFIPTLPSDKVTGNLIDSTYAGLWVTALNALKTQIPVLVSGAALAVLSRVVNHARRTTGIGRIITLIQMVNLYVDVAKRRLPQHKRKKRHV